MNSTLTRLPEESDDGDVSCFTTSLPTVPVAPVTKMAVSLFLVVVVIGHIKTAILLKSGSNDLLSR